MPRTVSGLHLHKTVKLRMSPKPSNTQITLPSLMLNRPTRVKLQPSRNGRKSQSRKTLRARVLYPKGKDRINNKMRNGRKYKRNLQRSRCRKEKTKYYMRTTTLRKPNKTSRKMQETDSSHWPLCLRIRRTTSVLWLTWLMGNMYSHQIKIVSWNVRGLCSMSRQSYVRNVVKQETPEIMLLQETKIGDQILAIKNYDCIPSKPGRGSAGCMILAHQKLKAHGMYRCKCGRIVACKVQVQGETLGIVNVYATNEA